MCQIRTQTRKVKVSFGSWIVIWNYGLTVALGYRKELGHVCWPCLTLFLPCVCQMQKLVHCQRAQNHGGNAWSVCHWTHCVSFFSLIFYVEMFACVRISVGDWNLLLPSFKHIQGMSVGAQMCLYSSVSTCTCVCTYEGQGSPQVLLSLFSSFGFWCEVSLNLEFLNSAELTGQKGPQTCLSPYHKFPRSGVFALS